MYGAAGLFLVPLLVVQIIASMGAVRTDDLTSTIPHFFRVGPHDQPHRAVPGAYTFLFLFFVQ
jgi:hypothetical protein